MKPERLKIRYDDAFMPNSSLPFCVIGEIRKHGIFVTLPPPPSQTRGSATSHTTVAPPPPPGAPPHPGGGGGGALTMPGDGEAKAKGRGDSREEQW